MARKKQECVTPPEDTVIYARYSSHAQKDVSIEQQVAECKEYANTHNMRIVEVYSDRALTGKTDRRPEFQKMIRHAEKRRFRAVLAYKSNRLGRNMLQALANENTLAKYGVRVVYVKEEFGDNPAGRYALRNMMNMNQFYSENMAEEIKRGMRNNAEKCMITNGGLPLGYKKGEDGRYALDEQNAAIVREIFRRVASGEPYADIAAGFNARGIKTGRGGCWNKGSFHRLIQNERYTGVYVYEDVRIEGGVPQIIERELFDRVQYMIHNKKNPMGRHRENGDYLLTGKLFCGKCKSPMVGVSGTGKSGKLHHYYACQKRRLEKDCDKAPVRRDMIERAVAAAIKECILRDDVIAWVADMVMDYSKKYKEKSDIPILEAEISENKRATKNLLSAIEQGAFTTATKDRLFELEAELKTLTVRLAEEHAEVLNVSKDDVISWLESLRDGSIDNKKYRAHLFKMFLTAVYVYDGTLKISFEFTEKRHSVKIPFDIDTVETSGVEYSYKVPCEPPIPMICECV